MHGVLHDWPDERAREILRMQKEAMKHGYSRLLVHEHVVSEAQAHPHATAYDLTMMVKVASEERTESRWRELLRSAGYEVCAECNRGGSREVMSVEIQATRRR